MLKAIIFDMDGVLVDSVKPTWDAINILLKADGVTLTDADIKDGLARSLRDNLQVWRKQYGIPQYDLLEFSQKAFVHQREWLKTQKADPHLVTLLQQAQHAGIKCGVATSSMRWRAEKILELLHIRSYFEQLATSEDVTRHKPAPDVYLEAARRLGVAPAECVVIEDAGDGISAAKSAAMRTVGLVTPYHTAKELGHADLVVKDFSQLDMQRLNALFTTKRPEAEE